MKTVAKALLILVSFMLIHGVLRLVYQHTINVYEMSLPHCRCGDPQPWLILLVRVTNFFFIWPIGNTLLSDFIWGSAATALYFWIVKQRKVKQRMRVVKVELQVGAWPPAPKRL